MKPRRHPPSLTDNDSATYFLVSCTGGKKQKEFCRTTSVSYITYRRDYTPTRYLNRPHITSSRMTSSKDQHGKHIWLVEPPTTHGVLTADGVDNIVHHKYKAGTYTMLDNYVNPLWEYLTGLLPLWLAPNAVTTIGASFSLLSYVVTSHVCYDFQGDYPGWVLILNGLCLALYYTLDCMDGKQARRTQSSSPMGQLFDHGLDCVGNLSTMSLMQGLLGVPASRPFLVVQGTMQMGFFQAQLEEYYTGTLTHATGDFGITEVLYGLATLSILKGLGLLGDATFYSKPLPSWTSFNDGIGSYLPGAKFFLERSADDEGPLEIREGFFLIWAYGFVVLLLLSLSRVTVHILTKAPSDAHYSKQHLIFSSLTKLLSPMILFVLSLYVEPLAPALGGVRYPSIVFGLAHCLMTIKVIVLGMAHMAYSTFQWADLLPPLMLVSLDWGVGRDAFPQIEYGYPLVAAASVVRLLWWARESTGALCQALHIQVFQISYPKKTS